MRQARAKVLIIATNIEACSEEGGTDIAIRSVCFHFFSIENHTPFLPLPLFLSHFKLEEMATNRHSRMLLKIIYKSSGRYQEGKWVRP